MCPQIYFWYVVVQLFQQHLVEKAANLCYIVLPLFFCQRPIDYIYVILFLVSLFHSIESFIYSLSQHHTATVSAALQQLLKSGSVSPPTLFFAFNIVLAILGLVPLQINFRISLSNLQNNLLTFGLRLHQICRSQWGEFLF